MKSILACLIPVALMLTLLPGCAAKPRERPLPTSDVEKGSDTVEHARRQLEGTWTLERFEVIEAGIPRQVSANGQLTYDAYGNLTVHGVLKEPLEPGAADQHPLLNYSGRIVIDPVRHEFRLADAKAETPVSESTRKVLDPERVRRYSFENGRLVLLLVPPNAPPAARATFVRAAK